MISFAKARAWGRLVLDGGRPAATEGVSADPLSVLDAHAVIGWDLDDTLLGHPASTAMLGYIRAHPEKRHVIVTFRADGGQAAVWRELGSGVSAVDFVGLEMIDGALARGFARLHRWRRAGLFAGPQTLEETTYLEWKGSVCARHGANVLVDDMTEAVRRGCALHGVTLLHPDVFR